MEKDIGRAALVLLHFQKDICAPDGLLAPNDPDALARYAGVIEKTKVVLAVARKAGLPVIHSAFGRSRGGHFANRHGRMALAQRSTARLSYPSRCGCHRRRCRLQPPKSRQSSSAR